MVINDLLRIGNIYFNRFGCFDPKILISNSFIGYVDFWVKMSKSVKYMYVADAQVYIVCRRKFHISISYSSIYIYSAYYTCMCSL